MLSRAAVGRPRGPSHAILRDPRETVDAGPEVRRRQQGARDREARRGGRPWTTGERDLWALDAERRAAHQKVEELRHRQRVCGEEIARLGKAKEDASALKAEMKGVADEIKALEARLEATESAPARVLLVTVPNLPDASVPVGRGRGGQRRGAPGGRAPTLRLRAQAPLGPRDRPRHPRLRAGRQDLRGALRRLLGRRGAARAGARSSSCSTCTRRARLPRGAAAVPRHRRDPDRHRPAPEVRGRPLQDPRRETATST